jgi:predicted aconitase
LRANGRIPYLKGLPKCANEDNLKALGAAGASSGAIALFHAEGLTPEANETEIDNLSHENISVNDLTAAVDGLCPVAVGDRVAAVCLGTPHYSISEFEMLTVAVMGRKRSPSVELFVSTSREIAEYVTKDATFAGLHAFGVNIVVDTCTYLAPVVRQCDGAILTTSAKYSHYGPGNLSRRIALMTLDRCIRSAEAGEVSS